MTRGRVTRRGIIPFRKHGSNQSIVSRFWHWLMNDKVCPWCGSTETRDEQWEDWDFSDAVINDIDGVPAYLVEPERVTVEVLTCLACGERS